MFGFTHTKNFKVNYAFQYTVIVCIHDVQGLYMLQVQHRKVRGQLLGASSRLLLKDPRTEPRSSGCVASTFIRWAISLAPSHFYLESCCFHFFLQK